jgi:probable phosphoglycerate mutase
MRLYYIRHADPDYEHDSLTEIGKIQADKTGKYLANFNFDRVFSSPLGRTQETASYLKKYKDVNIELLPFASEDNAWKYFSFHNEEDNSNHWLYFYSKTLKVMKENANKVRWYKNPIFDEKKVKEGLDFYKKEIQAWLLSLGIQYDYKNRKYYKIEGIETPECIALFAHGGAAMPITSYLLGRNLADFSTSFSCLDTCGITVIDIDLELHTARLLTYGETKYEQSERTYR